MTDYCRSHLSQDTDQKEHLIDCPVYSDVIERDLFSVHW